MALVRLVVGDQSSVEVDQLRKTVNALLLVLQRAGENIVAGDSAEDVLQSIGEGIAAGVDSDPETTLSSGTPTGLELVGLRVMNRHPRRPGMVPGSTVNTKDMTDDDAQK